MNVNGNVAIGTNYTDIAAPSNGMIVEAMSSTLQVQMLNYIHFLLLHTHHSNIYGSGSLGTSGSMNIVDGTKISPVHFTGYQEVQSGGEVIVCEVPYVGGIADSRLTGTLEVNYMAQEDSNRTDILYLEYTILEIPPLGQR